MRNFNDEEMKTLKVALEAAIFENQTNIRFGGLQTERLDELLKNYKKLLKKILKDPIFATDKK